MFNHTYQRAIILTFFIMLQACQATPPVEQSSLMHYNIDNKQISVSGMSAGAFMSIQLHIAYSKTFMGMGSIAGGIYSCAEGSMETARFTCMRPNHTTTPQASHYQNIVKTLEIANKIDSTNNLKNDKVWIMTGSKDIIVKTEASDRLEEFYKTYTNDSNISYSRDKISAAHTVPTKNYGNACEEMKDPFISNCDYDAAGELLQHIYGQLNEPITAIENNLTTFSQKEFTAHASLGDTGYIYTPSSCQTGSLCKLHVVLHGCIQSKDIINDQYARHAGYNEWAEANNIIVIYPQTGPDAFNQCWDWWGYSDNSEDKQNHISQNGVQMKFIKTLIDHLSS